jgi:branched-chain amino acid transport system substrate-binding protein
MKKILFLLAVLCICALAAVAGKEPYVIGAVFDITGPAAPLGTPERDTAVMLVKKINANGGINGHPIKLVVLDNQSEEAQSVSAVKKLIESEKVIAIIGPSQTGTTLAVSQTIEAAKIPLISCAAGVKIVDPVKPFIFKTAQSDVSAVAKVLTYCKSKKIKNIAIITVGNAFGDSGKAQLIKQCPGAGISILGQETFGDKDTDMSSQLMKIRAKNPQAVICWGTNPGPAMVAKNMKQLGMKMPLILSHGVANRKFIELAGDAAEGVIFPSGKLLVYDDLPKSDPQKKVLTAYANEYKAAYNKTADTFGGHAYDAITVLVDAIEEVGPNPLKIRAQIEKTRRIVGISGVFYFSAKDHNGLNEDAFVMVTIVNGDWKMAK